MKTTCLLVVGLAFASCVCAQSIPPYHLSTSLNPGGEVQLIWELAPLAGLNEDFEDGIAQGFDWWTPTADGIPQYSYFNIDSGYVEIYSDNEHTYWSSGANNLIEYTDFTCVIETKNISGSTLSRGVLFRGDGPRDADFNGYGFLISGNRNEYGVWNFNNGNAGPIIYWTETDVLNYGAGTVNTLKVVGQGSNFDFYINDIYVDSATNWNYSSGFVGFMQANYVHAQYEYITCSYEAELMPRHIEPERGEVLDIWLDEAGNPTDTPPVIVGSEPFVETEGTRYRDLSIETDNGKREILRFAQDDNDDAHGAENATADGQNSIPWDDPRQHSLRGHQDVQETDELDEFVEYRIYRDDVLIGTSETETFTDQLPAYGEYEYRITAYYDPEGESIPSVAATANWQAVTYNLTGQNTVIPSTGGTVTYDAQLFSELGQQFPGASYRTFVTAPDQTVYGPTFQYNFTLAPFMNIMQTGLTQVVPAGAPPGDYVFTGKLFYQGTPILEQSFDFDKMGGP